MYNYDNLTPKKNSILAQVRHSKEYEKLEEYQCVKLEEYRFILNENTNFDKIKDVHWKLQNVCIFSEENYSINHPNLMYLSFSCIDSKYGFFLRFYFDNHYCLYIPVDLLHHIKLDDNSDKSKNRIEALRKIYKNKPSNTEKKISAKTRIGQGKFREYLIQYWNGKCAVTGFEQKELLRASHIKPWRDCDEKERGDKFNGLLLAPGLDSAFDKGYITFSDIDGSMLISDKLSKNNKELLGIVTEYPKLSKLDDKHKVYLRYHLSYVYEKWK